MKIKTILSIALALCLPVFQIEAGGQVKVITKVVEETVESAVKHGGSLLGKTAKSKASRELIEEAVKKYGDDVIEETAEIAAKRSGKTLSKTAEATFGEELIEVVGKYGDDVIPIVREGGLEVIEQGTKHGDDFWLMCKQVPAASRAMALHADDLMPLAKRIGPEVLEIEARHPGTAAKIASEFGDDAVKQLAHSDDIPRLLGYAAKADSPETKRLLYEMYSNSKEPRSFLERLDWKQIMSYGLSSAGLVAAGGVAVGSGIASYKLSDGIQTALNNPEVAESISWTVWGIATIIALLIVAFILWKNPHLFRKKKTESLRE